MNFLSEHLEWILGAAAVILFLVQAVRALKKAKRIDSEGIVTDAVVSRIEEIWDPDTLSSSYTTYVRYITEDGETLESPLSLTADVTYDKGQQLRIRYVPGVRDMVRPA